MKFISHKLALKTLGKTHNLVKKGGFFQEQALIHSYVVFENLSQAKRYQKQGYLALSQDALDLAYAIKENSELRKFVLEKRMSLAIKVPLSIHMIRTRITEWKDKSPCDIIDSLKKNVIVLEAKRKYNIQEMLLPQIPMLVNFDSLFLPALESDIKIIPEYAQSGRFICSDNQKILPTSININISSRIKVSQIKKYIYANQDYIESQLKLLEIKKFRISELERKVWNEGNQKARKVGEDLGLEEYNVRRKKSDVHKKIKSLFEPKSHKGVDEKIKL